LRQGRELFAALLVPVALLGAGVWVALLSLANVRERRGEIGILRALGTSTRQVLGVFLGRALLVGVAGGVLGLVCGVTAGLLLGESVPSVTLPRVIFSPLLLGAALGAPLLSCLAGWAPALLAAKQDPATILLEE
jgi:putative ABC transport system permease protein